MGEDRAGSPKGSGWGVARPMTHAERLQAEADAFRTQLIGGAGLSRLESVEDAGARPKALWGEHDSDEEGRRAGDGVPPTENLAEAAPAASARGGEMKEFGGESEAQEGDVIDDSGVSIWTPSRSVEEFERLNMVDEGTFGTVFRARDPASGRIYALKQVKMEREREGFPVTSVREFNMLLALRHENIVNVREVVVGRKMDSVSDPHIPST